MSDNVIISLPQWVKEELHNRPTIFSSIKDKMGLVIQFSRLNVKHDTGGPFAAGVFVQETGELVSMGVNRVVPLNCSVAHAEVVAISRAQHKLGVYDLGGPGLPDHELVVNWCPCVMCYGAILWSGIRTLTIGGRGPELLEITGFDEGPLHPEWIQELQSRGISFNDNVMKEEACDVFRYYMTTGGIVYNGRNSGSLSFSK